MTGEDTRRSAASYPPTAQQLTRCLIDLGGGLAAQCAELQGAPTPERAERLACNLDGTRLHVLKLRERILAEGEGGGDGP